MIYLAKKPILVVFLLTLICSAVLDLVFHIDNFLIRLVIMLPIIFLLAPKKKTRTSKTGTQITQIRWLFLKAPLIIQQKE